MLVQLSIRDIVLIDRLDITFSNGLSVLTGETGAGKSILLDALSLALGARGDGGLVRNGVQSGHVSAMFDLAQSHWVSKLLEDKGIASQESENYLILKRVQSSDGRSKAFINDQPVSISVMREVGHGLVELHGQHDERALLQMNHHRDLLDAFGGLEENVRIVGNCWHEWQAKVREEKQLREQVEAARREADYLASSVAELELLAPESGEEEKLAERRQMMMRSEKIAGELDDAIQTLNGDGSPIVVLSNLSRILQRKIEEAPGILEEAVQQLDSGLDALHLASQELESAFRASEFDPKELEQAEERLFALRAAGRKYSVAVENLPELAVKLANDLENLNSGESRLSVIEAQVTQLKSEYFTVANELSELRKVASGQLENEVMKELPALKLDQANFITRHETNDSLASEQGLDQVEFWVQTNPGTKPGPMVKIASGGELSRFLLALKVALADKGSAPTLVFDEIDTGVGGAVADAIGKRLGTLASRVQVLSVTHAPQVAARALNHFVISKTKVDGEDNGRVATGVMAIDDVERREEIARMLAGASITDEARAAAEQLLNQSAA